MRHEFGVHRSASFRPLISDKASVPKLGAAKCPPPVSGVSVEVFGEPSDEGLGEPSWQLGSLLPDAKFFGCTDLSWTQPCEDVGQLEKGQIALFRTGEDDPVAFIAAALARGAAGILTEQMLPCPIPQCVVGSVDRSLAQITASTLARPDLKILTVGVLGSSGKTSTCKLVSTILNAAGIRTACQSDLESSDGVIADAYDLPLPTGKHLVEWLSESVDCCSRVAVMELSERNVREGQYDAIEFDVLIVTGKSEANGDFGPASLECLIESLTPSGVVILPTGDRAAIEQVEEAEVGYVTYGSSGDEDFCVQVVEQSGGISTLMLRVGETNTMLETPLCGHAMATNIAASSALASLVGVSLADLVQHIETLRAIPGRGQRLIEFGCATVVLELGGSVGRASEALRTAKSVGVGGRIWCVFAANDQHEAEDLAAYGRVIERNAHHCVFTGTTEQNDSFLKRSHQFLDGVKECAAIRLVADPERAVAWAIAAAKPRDTIVVITNQNQRTAAKSRDDLNWLTDVVDSNRQPVDLPPDPTTKGRPISLKLFR